MTTPNYPGGPTSTGVGTTEGATEGTTGQAREVAGTAADESKHVAGVAKGEAQNVAGVAKDEAQNVAQEAKQQARGLLDDARSQVDDQSRTQRDRLVNTLRTFSDDLEQMASQGGRTGMATDVARQVAGKARDLSTHLDGREPGQLLDEVRDFARRKPGTFLLGAVAAGVVAGRLARGAKEAQSGQSGQAGQGGYGGMSGRSVYDDPRGTAAGAPTAGTGYPVTDPTYPTGSGVGVTGQVAPESVAGDDTFIDEQLRRGSA